MGVHRDKVLSQQQLEKWLVGSERIFITLSHTYTLTVINIKVIIKHNKVWLLKYKSHSIILSDIRRNTIRPVPYRICNMTSVSYPCTHYAINENRPSHCFKWGLIDCKIHLVTFLYIFPLVDCFKWALIDHIEKWRVHSESASFKCKIHLVTFLYIFLLVDCFKWALIDHIEKWRVHSELCQFQT